LGRAVLPGRGPPRDGSGPCQGPHRCAKV